MESCDRRCNHRTDFGTIAQLDLPTQDDLCGSLSVFLREQNYCRVWRQVGRLLRGLYPVAFDAANVNQPGLPESGVRSLE
jgi:hypothetical protein